MYKTIIMEVTTREIMFANDDGGSTRDRSLIRREIVVTHGVPSNHDTVVF